MLLQHTKQLLRIHHSILSFRGCTPALQQEQGVDVGSAAKGGTQRRRRRA